MSNQIAIKQSLDFLLSSLKIAPRAGGTNYHDMKMVIAVKLAFMPMLLGSLRYALLNQTQTIGKNVDALYGFPKTANRPLFYIKG